MEVHNRTKRWRRVKVSIVGSGSEEEERVSFSGNFQRFEDERCWLRDPSSVNTKLLYLIQSRSSLGRESKGNVGLILGSRRCTGCSGLYYVDSWRRCGHDTGTVRNLLVHSRVESGNTNEKRDGRCDIEVFRRVERGKMENLESSLSARDLSGGISQWRYNGRSG